jgi:methionyl-tRNA formyltransferase
MSKPGIIFMGTPEFAVPSLEILIRSGYPVRAVVTAADKPAGRGLLVRKPAVKIVAEGNGIPVLQPSNLKDDGFIAMLRDFSADLFVVVAFRMLPEKVWMMPPMGTVNLHASLLPSYRGAAPINHAIINGDKITGVTTFLIEKEIDKGKILMQEKTDIGDAETAGNLHDRLKLLGASLLLKTIVAMTEGSIDPVPQDEMHVRENLPLAPKISKKDCRIDWSANADRIYDFVRGFSPYPAAWTNLFGEKGREFKDPCDRKNISYSYFFAGQGCGI